MQIRSKVALLACAVFVVGGILKEVFSGSPDDSLDKAALKELTGRELPPFKPSSLLVYVGGYELMRNGSTKATRGKARALVSSNPTASAARVAGISLKLVGSRPHHGVLPLFGVHSQADQELQLRGLDITSGAGPILAFGRTVQASEKADKQVLPGYAEGQQEADQSRGDEWCHLEGTIHPSTTQLEGEEKTANQDAGKFVAGMVSSDCGYMLTLDVEKVDLDHVNRKVVNYGVWINILTMCQLRGFLSQISYTEEGNGSVAKLSVIAIAAQALMDAYDSFLHLSISTPVQALSTYNFAVISMGKFALFALVEVRYLLLIWRQRHLHIFSEGWEAVRQTLSLVYAQFYGALVGGLVLIFLAGDYLDILALGMQAYWIPQIVHDVRHGSRNSFTPQFVTVMSVTRSLQFLYLWGCPDSIFSGMLFPQLPGSPSFGLCTAAMSLQALQVAIMASQKYFGPRWFVPWFCLPHVHNYNRPASEIPPGTECVICMLEISPEEGVKLAITPCEHRFHETCLERWMDVKMECPTCRRQLPPLQ